jgi:aryl-alcohol dehydrogenase-like predicted oxidoreductase
MEKRYLGKSRLETSSIGLGCLGMSDQYGHFNDIESIATIHRGLELGMNFFDTADSYAVGKNEELVGKALKGVRHRAIIATKFGFVREGDSRRINGHPKYVKEACAASLKRLDMDYIDLYYLHRVDPKVPIEETVGAMVELVKEGKIRYIGLSETSANTLRRANAVYPVTALQSEYSLWTRDVEKEILTVCYELEIGFVAYCPLGRGFLTGQIRHLDELVSIDYRRNSPRFQGDNLRKNLDVIKVIEEVAKEKGCKPAQIVLAWLLAQGKEIVPIPGTKRRKYLEENIKAVGIKLNAIDIEKLNEISKKIVGPRYNEQSMALVNR